MSREKMKVLYEELKQQEKTRELTAEDTAELYEWVRQGGDVHFHHTYNSDSGM